MFVKSNHKNCFLFYVFFVSFPHFHRFALNFVTGIYQSRSELAVFRDAVMQFGVKYLAHFAMQMLVTITNHRTNINLVSDRRFCCFPELSCHHFAFVFIARTWKKTNSTHLEFEISALAQFIRGAEWCESGGVGSRVLISILVPTLSSSGDSQIALS